MSKADDKMDYMDEVIDEGGEEQEEEEEDPLDSLEEDDDDDDADDGPVDVHKFLDNEAELSGEGSSDEEEGEHDDVLEANEEADNDDVGDESEQRESIAKIFHKQQADADKRELLLYQEKLFEDGDLHMDGKVRQRKFKWRNVESAWIDPHDNSSDEEPDDGHNELPIRSDEVIINFKKDFPDGNPDNQADVDKESREPLRTIPMPAFGGPAGSILSYVVRDKKTCEMLSKKKASPAYEPFMKKTVKKHKIRSKVLFP